MKENPVVPNAFAALATAYVVGRGAEIALGVHENARFEFYGNVCAAVGLVLAAAKVARMLSTKSAAKLG